jgi:hypothetical protein
MPPTNPKYRSILLIGKWRMDPALDQIPSEGKTVKLERGPCAPSSAWRHVPGQLVETQELLDEVCPGASWHKDRCTSSLFRQIQSPPQRLIARIAPQRPE